MRYVLFMFLSLSQAAGAADVYFHEAMGESIVSCGMACIDCPPTFGNAFCAASTFTGDACVSPEFSQCIGTGGTIFDLRLTYVSLFEGSPTTFTAHEFFAQENGVPVQIIVLESAEIFSDGFESGDTSAWSETEP